MSRFGEHAWWMPERPHLAPDDVVHRLDRGRVPRRREGERGREVLARRDGRAPPAPRGGRSPGCRAGSRSTRNRWIWFERRDQVGRVGRQQPARRDLADPVGQVLLEQLLVEPGRTQQVEREGAGELRDLLLERHPPEQVLDPLVHRSCRVPVPGCRHRVVAHASPPVRSAPVDSTRYRCQRQFLRRRCRSGGERRGERPPLVGGERQSGRRSAPGCTRGRRRRRGAPGPGRRWSPRRPTPRARRRGDRCRRRRCRRR